LTSPKAEVSEGAKKNMYGEETNLHTVNITHFKNHDLSGLGDIREVEADLRV
jgi:hypothetical protein